MINFETKLKRISENERKILQCLSLFWEPITANEFVKLFKALEIRTFDDKSFNPQNVALLRISLIQKGLLRNVKELWGSGFQIIDEELKSFLSHEATSETWFENVVNIIQSLFSLDEYKGWYFDNEKRKIRVLRDYRLCIFQNQIEKEEQFLRQINELHIFAKANDIIIDIFSNPFRKEFLSQFEKRFQVMVIMNLGANQLQKFGSLRMKTIFIVRQ
jgi:hypothetical protein